MACKDCDKPSPINHRMMMYGQSQGETVQIRCINGHALLTVGLTPTDKCVKFTLCNREEKNGRCNKKACLAYSNNLRLQVKCPICDKQITYFITDKDAQPKYSQENENDQIIFIKDIHLEDNTVTIELGVGSVEQ